MFFIEYVLNWMNLGRKNFGFWVMILEERWGNIMKNKFYLSTYCVLVVLYLYKV